MTKILKPTTMVLLLLGSTGGAVAASPLSPEHVACKPTAPFPYGLRVVKGVRVILGKNGESEFAPLELDATTHTYFKPGDVFASVNFGATNKVQIVSAPANASLPYHPSLGYEMFLTLQGSSTVVLPDGRTEEQTPGSLVVMEDMGSKTGHAGRIGPCGSITLQIVPTTRLP